VFPLGAYLRRIGLQGTPDLAAVHRAHATSIPFENLDPHRGVPVSLEPEVLERKLLAERRGGYCFEQNLLLAAALQALGAEVEFMFARVRFRAPPGAVRPRAHLVLKVRLGGQTWHADVGFGYGTLLEPIPYGPGEVHEQSGWRFRVVTDASELVLQTTDAEGQWEDVYGFPPEPVPRVDLEVSNWFTGAHPGSPFVTGLVVAVRADDGTQLALSDWSGKLTLTTATPTHATMTEVTWPEVPELLATRFGLPGLPSAKPTA
jgi:N-hydroxyarylamine O-acetyltransferase